MSLKLVVSSSTNSSDAPLEYLFEEGLITIGRGQENALTLPAPRQKVGMKHAVVKHTEEGQCQLISSNATRLNERYIPVSIPHELNEGDVFEIGDFRIEVHFSEEAAASSTSEAAMNDENPFDAPVNQLIEALEALAETYEQESASQRREESLTEAFCRAHGPVSSHEAVQRSIGLLEGNPAESAPDSFPASPEEGEEAPSSVSGEKIVINRQSTKAAGAVLDTLTGALAKILQVPGEFQNEFLGHLLVPPPEAEFLYEGDGATIKQHLVEETLSEEEQGERLEYVEEAAELVAMHQVAMLEGYKASISTGTEELLTRLDPDAHQDKVTEQYDVLDQEVLEYVPVLTSPIVLERIREEWGELVQEDWSFAEQRIFRPAFAKAYLSQMGKVHSSDHLD